jgi:hypothetical protein
MSERQPNYHPHARPYTNANETDVGVTIHMAEAIRTGDLARQFDLDAVERWIHGHLRASGNTLRKEYKRKQSDVDAMRSIFEEATSYVDRD